VCVCDDAAPAAASLFVSVRQTKGLCISCLLHAPASASANFCLQQPLATEVTPRKLGLACDELGAEHGKSLHAVSRSTAGQKGTHPENRITIAPTVFGRPSPCSSQNFCAWPSFWSLQLPGSHPIAHVLIPLLPVYRHTFAGVTSKISGCTCPSLSA